MLNPFFRKRSKKGRGYALIGIKLEEANRTQLQVTKKTIGIFEQIGNFIPVDKENNLYKLDIKPQFIVNDMKGVKQRVFDLLSKTLKITNQYRTYDYSKARKSACYLEPIRLFTKLEEKTDNKPQQPKRPKGGVDSEN